MEMEQMFSRLLKEIKEMLEKMDAKQAEMKAGRE
jgi:hypothetical protein